MVLLSEKTLKETVWTYWEKSARTLNNDIFKIFTICGNNQSKKEYSETRANIIAGMQLICIRNVLFKSVVFRNMIRCVDICHSSAYTTNGERKSRVVVGTLADRYQHFLCNCRMQMIDVTNTIIVNIPNPLKISTNAFIVFFLFHFLSLNILWKLSVVSTILWSRW